MRCLRAYFHTFRSLFRWIKLGALRNYSLYTKLVLILFYLGFRPHRWLEKYQGLVGGAFRYPDTGSLEHASFLIRRHRLGGGMHDAAELAECGFMDLSNYILINQDECDRFVANISEEKMYNAQVPIAGTKVAFPNAQHNYWSIGFREWMRADFVRVLSCDRVQRSIKDYFGRQKPMLYSVNNMVTFPSQNPSPVVSWHRDHDTDNFCALFVYWTEVSERNGATAIKIGSHLVHDGDFETKYLEGDAGSAYLLDSFAYHKGNSSLLHPRVVTWFRFAPYVGSACFFNGDISELETYCSLLTESGWSD